MLPALRDEPKVAERRQELQRAIQSGVVTRRSALATTAAILRLTQAGLQEADLETLMFIAEGAPAEAAHNSWDVYVADLVNDGTQSLTWRLGLATAGGAALAADAFAGQPHLSPEIVAAAGVVSALAFLAGVLATINFRVRQRTLPLRRILGHKFLGSSGLQMAALAPRVVAP